MNERLGGPRLRPSVQSSPVRRTVPVTTKTTEDTTYAVATCWALGVPVGELLG